MNESYLNHTYVAILCGGTGTRVWPLSVNKKPKQFINFYSDKTLFQEAVYNAQLLTTEDKIVIITNHQYVDEIKKEAPQIPQENIIGEPQKRDTALAMGVAAAYINTLDPQAVIINLASDHVVGNKQQFKKTMLVAAQVAFQEKNLLSVGIQPTNPNPGFGYIRKGEPINKVQDLPINVVAEFTEKPSVERAKQFLETGEYLWNANMYTWTSQAILSAFQTLAPELWTTIQSIQPAFNTPKLQSILEQEYQTAIKSPIDTAISEKADNLVVIPGDFDWNDLGGWQVVYEIGEKNQHGNLIIQNNNIQNKPPVISEDTSDCLIYSSNQTIGLIGVNNLIIVDTGNGLLVCDRKRSNDVKKIVENLKSNGLDQYI